VAHPHVLVFRQTGLKRLFNNESRERIAAPAARNC
jgi:hypothetical protein